jgi:OmpA-OmpF porin, OOP family
VRARSHLRFPTTELDQGQLSSAEGHLAIAEPNAQAALALSPPDRCRADRAREGDRDGDGIPDAVDTCPDQPETYNAFQDQDGCPDDPDTDGDGVPDSRDACLLVPEDKDGYLDEDGCPELDNDADGIPDHADKCPNEPEDPDGFQDEDGCPDPDNDGDTVADIYDLCPNTPGGPGGKRPGCPDLIVVTAGEIRITQQIQFDTNKATIKPVSFPILDAVSTVLRENPKITLEVQGHTDNVGAAAHNQRLSQQRADSVKAYLVGRGIESARLVPRGYGMKRPLVPNTTPDNRALNRRVQFIRTEN